MVTYEACGSGLPIVASPMGAGRVVRNNCEGFVIDPYDDAAWIAAIQELANNFERRSTMAEAAGNHAQSFTWNLVAARRRRQVREVVGSESTAC